MPIVRDHADWWNCPSYAIDGLDALAAEAASGVEGFVLQFSDFGRPETLEHFMAAVAPELSG